MCILFHFILDNLFCDDIASLFINFYICILFRGYLNQINTSLSDIYSNVYPEYTLSSNLWKITKRTRYRKEYIFLHIPVIHPEYKKSCPYNTGYCLVKRLLAWHWIISYEWCFDQQKGCFRFAKITFSWRNNIQHIQ